jgi:glucose repression regulatory protein TUP1
METNSCKILSILEPDTIDAGVTSVAISPDGRLVAAGSLDMLVRIWDVATGNLIERLRGHKDSVYSVAFSPDGKGIVSGSLDKSLKYWDIGPLLRSPQRSVALVQGVVDGGSGKKEGGEKGSACTINFTGHKVSFFFSPAF